MPFMKWLLIRLLSAFCLVLFTCSLAQGGGIGSWDELVKASVVYAELTVDTTAYDTWKPGRLVVGGFHSGEVVEVVRDYNYQWYFVRAADGREGWVSVDKLSIPEDPEPNAERLDKEVLEAYVNALGLSSKTDQLVWVDIDRQLTHVFQGQEGSWRLVRTMLCSTGTNRAPTLRGVHEIAERGEWFFAERFGQGAENWVQFSGDYLFHSLPMDRQRVVVDYTLGKRSSSGCVRLSMEDSRWFYGYIKRGSTVFVH